MNSRVIAVSLFVVFVVTCVASAQSDTRFSLGASYLFGNVDGYVQTPSGGEPGTTSQHRPPLSKIAINNTSVYAAQFLLGFDDNEFYAGGQWIHMSGSPPPDTPLISQAQTFPAG